jgi:hypothetical protein
MTNEQLDEFERYFEAKDDAGAFKWLETNFPNYKDIVQEEFDKLKSEIAQTAPQILSASQTQVGQQPQPPSIPSTPSMNPVQPVEQPNGSDPSDTPVQNEQPVAGAGQPQVNVEDNTQQKPVFPEEQPPAGPSSQS